MVAINQNATALLIVSRSGQVDRWARRGQSLTPRTPPSAEDIRVHAWLCGRLAAVHRERHSWRAKVGRFLSRCGIVRS